MKECCDVIDVKTPEGKDLFDLLIREDIVTGKETCNFWTPKHSEQLKDSYYKFFNDCLFHKGLYEVEFKRIFGDSILLRNF